MALAAQMRRHLAPPVHALRGADGGQQCISEPGVGDGARRRRGVLPVSVRASGYLHTLLGEHAADRLDPEFSCTHLIDERTDQRWRGSSSLAKKIEAAFRISNVIWGRFGRLTA